MYIHNQSRSSKQEKKKTSSMSIFVLVFFFSTSQHYHNIRTNFLTVNCEMRKQANKGMQTNTYIHIISLYFHGDI